jgi:hypothetical protein
MATELKAIFREHASLLRRDPDRAINKDDMLLDEGARRDAV